MIAGAGCLWSRIAALAMRQALTAHALSSELWALLMPLKCRRVPGQEKDTWGKHLQVLCRGAWWLRIASGNDQGICARSPGPAQHRLQKLQIEGGHVSNPIDQTPADTTFAHNQVICTLDAQISRQR